jgi:signal transduction histidine kinase
MRFWHSTRSDLLWQQRFAHPSTAARAPDPTYRYGFASGPIAKLLRRRHQSHLRWRPAFEDAKTSRDAKTQFIAAASQDLGQPLSAAAMFFEQAIRTPDAVQRQNAVDGARRAFAPANPTNPALVSAAITSV